jgi:transposase
MSDLYWLTDEQMARLQPYFPKSHGKPRVDDRRVLSGIIFVNRNGLALAGCAEGLWAAQDAVQSLEALGRGDGCLRRMMEGLSAAQAERGTVMIDATYLKAHRTASSLRGKKGGRAPDRTHERRHEHQASCRDRCERSSDQLLHDRRAGQRLHRRGRSAGQPAQGAMAAGRPGL